MSSPVCSEAFAATVASGERDILTWLRCRYRSLDAVSNGCFLSRRIGPPSGTTRLDVRDRDGIERRSNSDSRTAILEQRFCGEVEARDSRLEGSTGHGDRFS